MKNYEVKYATKDLASGVTIKTKGKRVAFLVKNMFDKMKRGNQNKISGLVAAYEYEFPSRVVANKVEEEVNNSTNAQVDVPVETPSVETTKTENNVSTEVKTNSEEKTTSTSEKKYNLKNSDEDTKLIHTSKITAVAAPKRLLISKVFISKLKSHRKDIKFEMPAPVKKDDGKETAVTRYIELYKLRTDALKKVSSYEKEMAELIKNNGLTLDMVKTAMGRN